MPNLLHSYNVQYIHYIIIMFNIYNFIIIMFSTYIIMFSTYNFIIIHDGVMHHDQVHVSYYVVQ